MPAVKLSRQFYERLGDTLVNELVELLNHMDSATRNDLREQNELNFARFDAKLEQRLAEFGARLEQRLAAFEVKLEQRLAAFGVKLEQRLAAFEVKLEQRLVEFREQVTKGLEDRFEKRFALIDAHLGRLEQRLDQQNRLFILAWVTLIATVVGMGLR